MAVALIQVHKPNSCIGLKQSVPICQALEDFCRSRYQTNIVICGQPQLYVMENILLPSRITFLNTLRFLTMASIRTTLSLFLLELWRQIVLMQIVL